MKKRRIFIAINFSDQIKRELTKLQMEWADLPVNWTKESNLHITLVFIGYVDDDEMLEICNLTKEIAKKHQPFEIFLKNVSLGPPDGTPRMIWLKGENSPELAMLKEDLEKVLIDSAGSGFNRKGRFIFRPHITLARIRKKEWRELPENPKIDKDISLSASVDSIEVMQSHLSRSGSEYAVLETALLGEE